MWNHRLFGQTKISEFRGIYREFFWVSCNQSILWRKFWRHLLSLANDNKDWKFRKISFYLGALRLGRREFLLWNGISIDPRTVRTVYFRKISGRR